MVAEADYICFPSNNQINQDKELVLAGDALLLKQAYPTLPKVFGKALAGSDQLFFTKKAEVEGQKFIAIQTKKGWTDVPIRSLVQESINILDMVARKTEETFAIPLLGVSHGGMTKGESFEMIRGLPSNVLLFTLDRNIKF